MLLDSNIIIYAIKPEYGSIRDLITENETFISAISYLEVLDYHRLTDEDKKDFNEFFGAAVVIPISHDIFREGCRTPTTEKDDAGRCHRSGNSVDERTRLGHS